MTEIRPLAADDTIRQALDEHAQAQLDALTAEVAEDPSRLGRAFPAAARKTGRGPLAGADDVLLEDAVRVSLVQTAARSLDPEALLAELREVYRYGDDDEKRAVLHALSGAPDDVDGTDLLLDALRTNDTRLVAAAMGPHSDRLDDDCLAPGRPQVPVHRRPGRVGHRARAPRRPRAGRDGAALPARARGRRARRTPRRAGRPRRLRRLHPARPAEGLLMRIFDPHIHMTSRTTDDYEAMYAAGVRALVEPAFWLGQPRTSVGSFTDYFDALVGLGAVPRLAVRHRPPLHDRAQPQGGQRPAVRRGARRAARATSPRTAWSPWARSASTR